MRRTIRGSIEKFRAYLRVRSTIGLKVLISVMTVNMPTLECEQEVSSW
jgi:hypothetical protein